MLSYFYLFLFSLAVAAVLRAGGDYLRTGRAAFRMDDPVFLAWGLFFFALAVLFRLLARRSLGCSLCGRLSQDIVIFQKGPSRRFCRAHAIELFRREFTLFPGKMVVFYPALEMKKGPYAYEYRALEDTPEKFRESAMGRLIATALAAIAGKCSRCGRDATVAYFGPGSVALGSMRLEGADRSLSGTGLPGDFQITCPHCIADELCFSLGRFESGFTEGVVLPYNGNGVFLSRLG